ncbi:hypothetical protein DFH08DRAFT_820441 [Mycena albidolilacea]|uniref:Uncharacterized protein n=1 Tax=Mycena albidolilacea TaxID=1033008 RepID=A0AAD6ZCP2_9AGAR|nr:hypothetical protein DFH08DRAFT_820441 [Mycena albidolilacea]
MHFVPLSDLTFIPMAVKRPSPSKKSNYSGEDVDSVGYVVESDGEEEGHEEGMLEVERIVCYPPPPEHEPPSCIQKDSAGTVITTKDETVSEFRCCVEVEAISIPSNYFYEYLDVPAAEYLNSLHIQGRLFSNSRGKGLVIVAANDVPNQSDIEPGSTATMVAVTPYVIAMSEKHPICLVMKPSQIFFNSTGAKATDQLQLAPIFPVPNCVRATPSGLHFPNHNPIPLNADGHTRLSLELSQQAQELGLFNSEATTQPDGTAIVKLRNKIRIPFRTKGGEDWPKVPRLTDILILVSGFRVVNKTTLGMYSFRLFVDLVCRKHLLEATTIAKSGTSARSCNLDRILCMF